MYTLNQLADEGHCFAYREQLVEKAIMLLNASEPVIVMTMDQMLKDQDLILDADEENGDAIYLPPFYYAESGSANHLRKLVSAGSQITLPLTLTIEDIAKRDGIQYDEVQIEAIRKTLGSKVMVLTGGPGTGKTTVTKGIIAALQASGLKILLAAPTGRAAKRMTEATGLESKTIHRLLEFKPADGYQRNDENPLEGDVLIVDESSMIDIILMNSLLKAVPAHMRLILVGDIDQLPSVGAGNVLRDIINSGVVPVVRLTKIFRQALSSRIITNAHRINAGQLPDITTRKDSDFFFIQDTNPDHAAEQIVDLVNRRLPNAYKVSPTDIQVLAPMKKGVVGAGNLNTILQAAVNPSDICLRRAGMEYRLNDKVMQIKNDYDKEVFNGDIGTIEVVDLEERTLSVRFDDRLIEYDVTELDELTLSYATSIHKSQGSEFPIVVMPVLMSHYIMLQRNMIYTGITRAKKLLVIVGDPKALKYAVQNVVTTKRNSRLSDRLMTE